MSDSPQYTAPDWLVRYTASVKGTGTNGLPWDDPDCTISFIKRDGKIYWQSNPGPQTWFLLCPCDEILFGGSRGGGKSAALIAWFAMGQAGLAKDDPAKYSYLNDPHFRGLMLREQYQDLAEFVEEAREFYRPFNVKPKDDPVIFHFPSGAKIYTNHLGNEEAFSKYKGWNLTKIGIEEVTQIPTFQRYLKLLGSLRSVERYYRGKRYPKLRTQMALTSNPDGPGAMWVSERFVDIYNRGVLLPWNTAVRDMVTGETKVFIPARITDNKYLRDDKKYMGKLLSQDEVTRKQWIEGDWHAGSGLFFSEFRPDGPIGVEETEKTPWARHKIDSADLKPWWYRFGGLDVGYDHPAASHKFCRNEHDKRIHVYSEMVERRIGSFELGTMLAKWWMPELEMLPDHQVTIYVSPDAFSKTDETKTKAEQIEEGIKAVLGPYGALLLKYNSDEIAVNSRDPRHAAILFEHRKREFAGHLCIALQPANRNVSAGCAYIRDLLRFRPVLQDLKPDEDHMKMIFQTRGIEAYERERAAWAALKPEILPKLLIWKECRHLERCLKTAVRDDPPKNEQYRKFDAVEGVGGDDALDAFRYGCLGYKEIETKIPQSYWVADRCTEIQQQHVASYGVELTDMTRLMQIQTAQAALYQKNNPTTGGSFTLPRASSSRHRVLQ